MRLRGLHVGRFGRKKLVLCTVPLALLICSAGLKAQEVKYIDLTLTPQRTELRYPPAPPPVCQEGGTCIGAGSGTVVAGVADGAPDWRDPHVLGVYLDSVSPTDIQLGQPFEVEFRVVNTGRALIQLPVSPNLSDLQPSDASAEFRYLDLALVVQVDYKVKGGAGCDGHVELYGASDHKDTLLVLRPGDWIRVKADVKFGACAVEPGLVKLYGEYWLRMETYLPHPGGSSKAVHNLYPNSTSTPPVEVYLLRPPAGARSKH